MPQPSVVCLTGATGFIGGRLAARIRADGAWAVRALSRRGGAAAEGWHAGDLLDRRSLDGFIPEGAIVVHLAYLSGPEPQQNLIAASNIAEASLAAGASRLVYVSSAVVSGGCPDPVVTERSFCLPSNPYEETKLTIENLLISKMANRCRLVILRPTEVYGEGGKNLIKVARELRAAPFLARAVKRALLAHRRLHLVHVDNVVEAVLHVSRFEPDPGEIRYIVSEDDVRENNYGDVVDFLSKEWNLPNPAVFPSLSARLLPLLFSVGSRKGRRPTQTHDCSRLLRSGYRRPVAFQQGLRRFAAWYPGAVAGAR
jgi:nucleoside-diphosphate-sugar epimerase